MRSFIFLVLGVCSVAPADAQSPSADRDFLLDRYPLGAEGFFGEMRVRLDSELAALGVVITPEISAALDRHYSPAALDRMMQARFEAQGEPSDFANAARLIREGPVGLADSIAYAVPRLLTLDQVLDIPDTASAAKLRNAVVLQIVRAQGTAHLFVVRGEAPREAAHVIAEALSPGLPEFVGITEEEYDVQVEQNEFGPFVTFLHSYQAVSDQLLDSVLADWTTDVLQWYVDAYLWAFGESIVFAADNVAAEVGSAR